MPQTTSEIRVDNLIPSSTYNFQILALNNYGTTPNIISNITTLAVPHIITSIFNEGNVKILWNPSLPQQLYPSYT